MTTETFPRQPLAFRSAPRRTPAAPSHRTIIRIAAPSQAGRRRASEPLLQRCPRARLAVVGTREVALVDARRDVEPQLEVFAAGEVEPEAVAAQRMQVQRVDARDRVV